MRAIDGENAQVLAARDRDSFEIAEDTNARLSFETGAETFLLRHLFQIVRRVIRAPEELANVRKFRCGNVADHGAIMASLSQRVSA